MVRKVRTKVKIDTHIHLVGNGCCDSGIWLSERFKKRPTYLAIRKLTKISKQQEKHSIDEDWARKISQMLEESSVDYGVILGFDGVYHEGQLNYKDSQLIIPPEWVLLFAVSTLIYSLGHPLTLTEEMHWIDWNIV